MADCSHILAVMLVAFLANVLAAKNLDLINKTCIHWTVASVINIVVTILVMNDDRRNADFVLPILTRLNVAEPQDGLGLSVFYKQLPIGSIFKTATGSAGGSFGLLFLILGILLFAGVGALIAASRCTYAFASDGAIPGSGLWARVDERFNIPLWGLVLSMITDCILGCIYFRSTSTFKALTGVATIYLSLSYGIPILISLLRGRKAVRHSTFSHGRFGFVINAATVAWILFAIVLFCMPTQIPVTSVSMNYASVVFSGFALISVVSYIIRGRKAFTGPPVASNLKSEYKGEVSEGELARLTTNGENSWSEK